MPAISHIHLTQSPKQCVAMDKSIWRDSNGRIDREKIGQYRSLEKLGIFLGKDEKAIKFNLNQMASLTPVMDALQPLVTTASIATPIQFLQEWLPGFVHVITAARNIDKLVGISTVGQFHDEEIVQGVLELTGQAIPYGDYTNIPLASWNPNYVYRTIVRGELGLMVTTLEEMRASEVRIDSGSSKRESCALQLEILRNLIGFFGYNSGLNQTYGFLNDPNLPAYVTAATGASLSTLWSTKTFLEICADIRTMIETLRTQSKDQIDPEILELTLALATSVVDFLTTTSDFGISVRDWLTQTYPKVRIVSAPELDAANGGENVGYLYADSVNDLSTDDGRTWLQAVPAKYMTLGVERLAKGYKEDYANATAGVMLKRPFAVTRITGI